MPAFRFMDRARGVLRHGGLLIRVVTIVAVLFSAGTFVLGGLLWQRHEAQSEVSGRQQALTVTRALAATGNQAVQRNLYLVQEALAQRLDQPEVIDAEIVDLDDLVVASRRTGRIGRTLTDPEWRDLRAGGVEAVLRGRAENGAPALIVAEPLVEKGRIQAWVRVVYSLDGMERARRRELAAMLGLALLTAAIGVGGLALVARRSARVLGGALEPLREALRAAGTVAPADPAPSGAFEQLAGAVTNTARLIREQAQALRRAHADLEARVVERTAELGESRRRLELSLDASRAGCWSWEVGRDRLEWDTRSYALYGVDPDTPATYQTWIERVHPDDVPRLRARVRALLEGRAGDRWSEEFRVRHSDGSERWIHGVGRAERDGDGRVVRVSGLNLDITEKKQGEEDRRATHALLDAIVEHIPNMIFLKDATDLRFARFNRAGEALLGYPREALLGKNDYDFFPRDEADFFIAKDREVLAGADMLEIPEEPIRTKSGEVRYLHTKKVALRDELGRPRYLLGISEDITDRKRADEALRRSEAAIRELQAVTSNASLSFDQRVEALLQLGCKRFGQPIGVVTKTEGQDLRLTHVWAPGTAFARGQAVPLCETYCQETLRRGAPVAFAHAAASREWAEHPGYAALGLESYLGAPILSRRGAEGTLCFMGTDPRAAEFSEADTDFLLLMTRWLGGELDRRLDDAALRESEERYRTLVEHAGAVILSLSKEGVIRSWNPAAEAVYGYASEEALGKNYFTEFLSASARAAVFEDFRKVLAGVPTKGFENAVLTKEGRERILLWDVVRVLNERGEPAGAIAVGQDITARRQAEASLRESEARFQAATGAAAVAAWAWDVPRDEIVFSESLYPLLGRPADHSLRFSLRTYLELVHPDDREWLLGESNRLVEEGQDYALEYRLLRTDGVAIWVSDRGTTERDARGAAVRMTGVIVDITARKRAEAQVESLLEAAPDATVTIDRAGRIARINRQAETLFGYRPEELIGQPVEMLIPARFHGAHEASRAGFMAAPRPRAMGEGRALFARRKDGSEVPVEISLSPMEGDGGPLVIAAVRDISARKQAEAALRESERRLAAFLDHTPGFAWIKDAAGRYVYINSPFDRLLLNHAAWQGKTDAELWPPDIAAEFESNDRRVLAAGEPVQTFEAFVQDGERRQAFVSKFLIEREPDEPKLVGGIAIDVTEAKRAETALRESEERLRLFIEHSPVALAMFDRDMRYVAASRRWVTDFRLGETPPIGRSHYEVFPDIPERWKAVHRRCLDGAIERCDEDPFVRSDGRTDWLRWEVRPWLAADGAVGGIVIFSEDISARKQAESALQATEARLAFVADHAPVLIAQLDQEGRYRFVNRPYAALFGLAPAQVLGRPARDVLGEEAFAQASPHLDEALHGRAVEFDIELSRTAAGPRRLRAHYAPQFDAAGSVSGIIAAITDVTDRAQAEETQRRLAAIVESSEDAIVSKTTEGLVTSWNRGAERLFGYRAEEMLGRPITTLFPPDRLEEEPHLLERMRRGESIAHFETVRRRKDGRLVDVSLTLSPMRNPEGAIVGISKIVRDISARRRAEAALRDSNERFRSAFEGSPIGVALCTPEGRFLRLNRECCRMLGARDEEMMERHLADVIHSEDRPRFQAGRSALFAGARAVYVDEHRYLAGDQRTLTALLTLSTIRDEAGRPLYLLAQLQDLTQLRQTEAELRRTLQLAAEQGRFRALLSALPDLVFVVDGEGRCLEALAGGDREPAPPAQDLVGRTFQDLYPRELADRFQTFVGDTLATGRGQTLQYALSRPEGPRWYEAKSAPPIAGRSGPPAVLCVVRDVTERVRGQHLEAREQLGRDLHDHLLQSLYATRLALETSRELWNQDLGEAQRFQEQAVGQLNEVMRDVRQFIEGLEDRGAASGDWEADVRRVVEAQAGSYGVQSHLALDPEAVALLPARARTALLSILREALSNGLRHGRPTTIHVSLAKDGAAFRFRVMDDGCGFHPTSVGAGGRGLRNMKTRADDLGARFHVVSELGHGTEVVIDMPRQEVSDHVRIRN